MESTVENIAEMENKIVQQQNDKETETEDQSRDNGAKTDKEIETEKQNQENGAQTDKETETEEQSKDNVMETDKEIESEEQNQENGAQTDKATETEEQSKDNVMETDKETETEEQSKDSVMETVKEIETEEQSKDSVMEPDKETETEEQSKDSIMETDKETETEEQSKDSVMETDKEIETEEQSTDDATETKNNNSGETVREEDPVTEHKNSTSPMVIEKGLSHASNKVTPTLEKEASHDYIPEVDDEKNSKVETSLHISTSSLVALDPEEGLIKPTVEGTIERNNGSSEVTLDILKNDRDFVIVNKDTAVVNEETTTVPLKELSEDKESTHHHDITVTEQEKAAEGSEMTSSRDDNEITAIPDTKLSEDNELPLRHANDVMERDEAAEEHERVSAEDHNELQVSTDTKVDEENNDKIDEGEFNDTNLADHVSGPVDQGITTEVEKGIEKPVCEMVSNLEDKPCEPLIETSMSVEKEPDVPATENLTDNDKNTDEKGLSLLPATQSPSEHIEGVATLEAERTEDMELDVPDSTLVTDASVYSINNKDANVEAPTNAEKKDNPPCTDESASMRCEPNPDPACVASSDVKSEVGVSGGLNNGVHKINPAPPAFDGTMTVKNSFLLDDTADGNESGTEEDQSAFIKELYHFFRERNMEFKPPKFYGEGLNCLKLWRSVTRLGGYDKVTGCKLWRQVGESFSPPKTCTTVSWTFRGFYEKALLDYERHKVSGGELQIPLASEPEAMNMDNQASGSGRARRDAASRAMQGWHSQRLNGNNEVNDPAVKDKNIVLHQKREKQAGTTPVSSGLLKRKRATSTDNGDGAKNIIRVSNPMLDVTVADVGPPADWVKINVQRTQDCFEVYALVPGLVREEVRVQSDPAGRLVISGEPENPKNPWGATPFKKVVSLPTRIDPHHTSAVVTLNGQLFVRVPLEQSD